MEAVMPPKASAIFRLTTAGCWFDSVAADASPYLLDEPVQVEPCQFEARIFVAAPEVAAQH